VPELGGVRSEQMFPQIVEASPLLVNHVLNAVRGAVKVIGDDAFLFAGLLSGLFKCALAPLLVTYSGPRN
jgi:hypothetical protein